jgi:hypothetical protein
MLLLALPSIHPSVHPSLHFPYLVLRLQQAIPPHHQQPGHNQGVLYHVYM